MLLLSKYKLFTSITLLKSFVTVPFPRSPNTNVEPRAIILVELFSKLPDISCIPSTNTLPLIFVLP